MTDSNSKAVMKRIDEITGISDLVETELLAIVILFWMTQKSDRPFDPRSLDIYVRDTCGLYMTVLGDWQDRRLSGNPADKYKNFALRMKEVKRRIEQSWVATAELKASLLAS